MPKPINPVYGYKKGPEDKHDYKASFQRPVATGVTPPKATTKPIQPSIRDQSNLGSCTGHGIGRIYQCAQRIAKIPDFWPSVLFLYYNERRMENTISEDSGAIIRDGIKSLNKYGYGIVEESLWPYDITKFTHTPPPEVYEAAKFNTIRYYATLDGMVLEGVKLCIVHGYPFTFGFDVYQNFEDYVPGQVISLANTYGRVLGGHCVVAVEYDDSKPTDDGIGAFLCANSWGSDWGEDGYFWMSYEYMMSRLVSDKWMMRLK